MIRLSGGINQSLLKCAAAVDDPALRKWKESRVYEIASTPSHIKRASKAAIEDVDLGLEPMELEIEFENTDGSMPEHHC